MKRLAMTAAVLIGVSGCTDEGPWGGPAGTKLGVKKEQIEKYAVLQKDGSNSVGATMHSSKQAPNLSSQADSYDYVFTKAGNLCMVQMHFEDVNKSGSPLMAELMSKYGKPIKDDRVPWGVVWDSARYKLSDDLTEIATMFTGKEPNVSARVSFMYKNIDQCRPK